MNNFFINLLLLISVIFVGGHLTKDKPLYYSSKVISKIYLGFGGGILAIAMMIYTINISGTNTLIDLRIISLMMVYYIGGILPSIITGIITILFRTIYYGYNQSSIAAAFQIAILISLYYIINYLKLGKLKKWIVMLVISMISSIILYWYLLFDVKNVLGTIIEYCLVSIIAGIIAYYLLKYVKGSNELYRRYKNEASKDFLTGLNNAREFDLIFNNNITKAKEKNEELSALMIDIDHFKNVNDTYGHPIGDIVLRELAVVLKKTCRIFDVVSRVGGEEFCILLPNCSVERAVDIGKRICDEVRRYRFDIGNNNSISITVSIGVSTYPDTTKDIEKLLKQADDNLYKAKQTGRNKVCTKDICQK